MTPEERTESERLAIEQGRRLLTPKVAAQVEDLARKGIGGIRYQPEGSTVWPTSDPRTAQAGTQNDKNKVLPGPQPSMRQIEGVEGATAITTGGRTGISTPQGSIQWEGKGTPDDPNRAGRRVLDSATIAAGNENMRKGGGGGGFVLGSPGSGIPEYEALSNDEKIQYNVNKYKEQTQAIRDLRNARRQAEGSPLVGERRVLETTGPADGGEAQNTAAREYQMAMGKINADLSSGRISPRKALALKYGMDDLLKGRGGDRRTLKEEVIPPPPLPQPEKRQKTLPQIENLELPIGEGGVSQKLSTTRNADGSFSPVVLRAVTKPEEEKK